MIYVLSLLGSEVAEVAEHESVVGLLGGGVGGASGKIASWSGVTGIQSSPGPEPSAPYLPGAGQGPCCIMRIFLEPGKVSCT